MMRLSNVLLLLAAHPSSILNTTRRTIQPATKTNAKTASGVTSAGQF
jgi:hypothetical protein